METRASHIVVGGFVLALIGGLIAFAVWIAKVDLDAEYKDYDIFFDGTVSGLYKRANVFYLGIPVGEVRDITLAPNDPSKVRVWIRINADVPVTDGAIARLEFQGLTGVGYIEIYGGEPGSKPLEPFHEQERAVIPAEASAFQEVYTKAPNLIDASVRAVTQFEKLLNDDNIAEFSSLLANTDDLAANLARGTEDIEAVVNDARATLVAITEAAGAIETLANSSNEVLSEEAKRLVDETVLAVQDARKLIQRVDGLVAANEGAVTQFVGGTLPEVSRMVIDLRRTARNLSRLVSRIEQNPKEAILGPGQEPYSLEKRANEEEK